MALNCAGVMTFEGGSSGVPNTGIGPGGSAGRDFRTKSAGGSTSVATPVFLAIERRSVNPGPARAPASRAKATATTSAPSGKQPTAAKGMGIVHLAHISTRDRRGRRAKD